MRKALLPLAMIGALAAGGAQAQVDVMLPANPGGGWDTTGRQALQAMQDAGIYEDGANFSNVGGAGGTIGLAQFQGEQAGDEDALSVFGAITVGSILLNDSPIDLSDFTPIARLTAEYPVLAVSADSEFETLDQFVNALKEDPGAHPVGGGSAGGTDHITLALLAQEAGIPVSELNYIPQASGAETVTGIVNGTLAAGISGISEFQQFADQGRIRILGIASEEPKEGVDAPTFQESGYDVVTANWRGFLGAPDMPEENRQLWVERFQQMSESPEWRQVLETQGWDPYFLAGDEFGAFIEAEEERIGTVLSEAGLVQ